MLGRFLLLILLTALPQQLQAASPPKARSLSGIGLMLIRNESGARPSRLVLYREPAIGRVADKGVGQLPSIVPSLLTPEGLKAIVVTEKKVGWYRIVYDDGERQGWLQESFTFKFQRWEELLQGRGVTLPAGLKKDFYQLRSKPDAAAEPLETLGRESVLTVQRVIGDWLHVQQGGEAGGWLRWRDDNDRLLVHVLLTGL